MLIMLLVLKEFQKGSDSFFVDHNQDSNFGNFSTEF